MVMIVRTAPDAAWTEGQDTKNAHDPFCHQRARQDGVMLLIMIDDEKTQDQQSGEHAADDPSSKVKIHQCSANRRQEQKPGRQNAPPASHRVVNGIGSGGLDELFSGSHVFFARTLYKCPMLVEVYFSIFGKPLPRSVLKIFHS